MVKKIGIILFFVAVVGARHAVPLQGLPLLYDTAFAANQDDGTPCPPECVTDSMEIVTWYPSPYNEYEELRLYPISESNSPNGECGQDNRGLMYYDKDDDKVYICKGAIEGWKELGGSGNLPQSTTSSSFCDSNNLGKLIYDTSRNRPYVCALNGSSYVWKPLDSDYDQDGVTDAVDYNDNDANDATATEVDVAQGKTFYSGGIQPKNRKTGTLNAIKGVFAHREVGMDAGRCGGNSSCRAYLLYSSVGEVSVDASYSSKGECCYTARPFRCKSPFSERSIFSVTVDCGNPYSGCSYMTHICE